MEFPDFSDPAVWISLLTLSFLEIVLGVDNIIFISIVSSKLREELQERARKLGLTLAMFFRIGLLLTITWIIKLTTPLFTIGFIKGADKLPIGISWKDIILFAGGVFLIAKSTIEIHHKLEQSSQPESSQEPTLVFLQLLCRLFWWMQFFLLIRSLQLLAWWKMFSS